ncbi:MAG: tyrosine recombinase XerC [Armatimonadota bacterium]|nr:MAG: tyrosine recombinase XerC [Armatimonadota bacterium]
MHTSTNLQIRDTVNSAYSLHTAVELFCEDAQARGLRPRTVRFYRDTLARFAHAVNMPLEQIDPFTLRRYLLHRQQQVSSLHTVHADYRALRAFFRWLVRNELLNIDPMRKVSAPKTDTVCKPPLTEDEIRRILQACAGNDWLRRRDHALVLTLLDTGLRVGELVQMTVADGTTETFTVNGKSRRTRLVCLSAQTRLAIRKYVQSCPHRLDAESPLWVGVDGNPLTVHGVQEAIQRVGKRAGLKEHLGCHVFRRTFAIYSLRSGMSLEHLRELLGHRDFAMLKHYVQLVETDLRQAHQQHSPLRMLKMH